MTSQLTSLLVAGALDTLTYWSLAFLIASGLTVVFWHARVPERRPCVLLHAGRLSRLRDRGPDRKLLAGPPARTAAHRPRGLAVERLLFRRLYAAGHTPQLLLTIGLAYVIAEATRMVWGDSALTLQPPASLAGHVALLGATLPVYHLFIVLVAAVLVGALALLVAGTRLGMVVRAAAVHPEMVEALGFRLSRIHTLVFLIGIFLAATCAILAAMRSAISR